MAGQPTGGSGWSKPAEETGLDIIVRKTKRGVSLSLSATALFLLWLSNSMTALLRSIVVIALVIVWLIFGIPPASKLAPIAATPPLEAASTAAAQASNAVTKDTSKPQKKTEPKLSTVAGHFVCLMLRGKPCETADTSDQNLAASQAASQGALAILPIVAAFVVFWRTALSTLARACLALGGGHLVLLGGSGTATAIARLAVRGKAGRSRRAVILIDEKPSSGLEETLHEDRVFLVAGRVEDKRTLERAGVKRAARVLALGSQDGLNLRAAHAAARVKPVSQASTVRARVEDNRLRSDLTNAVSIHASHVVSLSEIAARRLMRDLAIHRAAKEHGHECPHIAVIGFDQTGEAVAAWAFRMLWSKHFSKSPKVTVFAPNAADDDKRFNASYPQTRAHDIWKADIAFKVYAWRQETDPWAMLRAAETERGPLSAIVIAFGKSDENIAATLALSSRADPSERRLILVEETEEGSIGPALSGSGSIGGLTIDSFGGIEESAGDLISDGFDDAARNVHEAYLSTEIAKQNLGAWLLTLAQKLPGTSRRALGLTGKLNETALSARAKAEPNLRAELETAYVKAIARTANVAITSKLLADARRKFSHRMLRQNRFTPNPKRPAQNLWEKLSEPYLQSNRAAADHTLVKLWDLGFVAKIGDAKSTWAAKPLEKPLDMNSEIELMAAIEHKRWMAERLFAGWRPGERDDLKLEHPDFVDWGKLHEETKDYDRDQVRSIFDRAPLVAPDGIQEI